MTTAFQHVPKTWIVVPCHNEAARLRLDVFKSFSAKHPEIVFIMVDDGSSDETLALLRGLESDSPSAFHALALAHNQGKAEAVRRGMIEAFGRDPRYVGYWDADLATPLEEIPRFIEVLDRDAKLEAAFGSRVQLLGRSIQRSATRHYLGRVIATAISLALDLRVYDTQCGAKLFRASKANEALFEHPFLTSWVFDAEIVARLIAARRERDLPQAAEVIQEVPLEAWCEVAGSKVKPIDFFRSIVDVYRIWKEVGRGGE
jgi:dolichyl-phosphate beta-glucosyltransferase